MKCLEFKRIALSDPQHSELNFIEHSENCVDCLKYVSSVRQMDADLARSLDTSVPHDLAAKLQLNQALQVEAQQRRSGSRYAIAASLITALVLGGFLLKNQFSLERQIDADYQSLLAGVVNHMNTQPLTPVWDSARANRTVNTLLASYDTGLRFKQLDNLQFGRICPLGEYRGLHASLETDAGSITFAFIKGDAIGDLLDASYQGFVTRIRPLRDGNLIIISRNQRALEQVDKELAAASYWDI